MPSEITPEKARETFLDCVRSLVDYWEKVPDCTIHDRCDGVAFSILCLIDGVKHMPSFDLVLRPHKDDQQYCIENDEDWYVDGQVINGDCMLHEQLKG